MNMLGCTLLGAQEQFVDEATAAALLVEPMNLTYPRLARRANLTGVDGETRIENALCAASRR